MTTPTKSHGRKAIRPTLKPTSLMEESPDLIGVWQARVVTLFPEVFPGVLGASLTGKALKDGKWQLHTHDLRGHGIGKHRNVDDTPTGGGAGMYRAALEMQEMRMRCVWKNGDTDCLYTMMHAYRISD